MPSVWIKQPSLTPLGSALLQQTEEVQVDEGREGSFTEHRSGLHIHGGVDQHDRHAKALEAEDRNRTPFLHPCSGAYS